MNPECHQDDMAHLSADLLDVILLGYINQLLGVVKLVPQDGANPDILRRTLDASIDVHPNKAASRIREALLEVFPLDRHRVAGAPGAQPQNSLLRFLVPQSRLVESDVEEDDGESTGPR